MGSVKIHALQTGTVILKKAHRKLVGPPALRLLTTILDWRYTQPLPIYTWLIEHPEGLMVVDTGENAGVMQKDYFDTDYEYRFAQRFGRMFKFNVPREQEIGMQLKAMGINSRKDIRWVVLTHLHADHVDGLRYFPNAEILIALAEFSRTSRAFCRWPIWFRPSMLVEYHDGPVGAFSTSHAITRVGDVRLVPTHGHTFGHQSVLVQDGDTDVFIAGDAAFDEGQVQRGEVAGIVADVALARHTLQTIRKHAAERPTVILPTHDPEAAMRLERRTTTEVVIPSR